MSNMLRSIRRQMAFKAMNPTQKRRHHETVKKAKRGGMTKAGFLRAEEKQAKDNKKRMAPRAGGN